MTLTYWIQQLGCSIFGAAGIFLVGSKAKRWRRVGFILGCCSQPFWLWATAANQQWGMLALSVVYTISWLRGLWNMWGEK